MKLSSLIFIALGLIAASPARSQLIGFDDPIWLAGSDSGGTSALIPQASGTAIGSMTSGGGLAASFDGNKSQLETACSWSGQPGPLTGYVGKDWGAGVTYTITSVKAWGSNNRGFANSFTCTVTLTVQGSTDNFSSSIVDLGSTSFVGDDWVSPLKIITSSSTTAYRYHRLKIVSTTTGGVDDIQCCELEFYGY